MDEHRAPMKIDDLKSAPRLCGAGTRAQGLTKAIATASGICRRARSSADPTFSGRASAINLYASTAEEDLKNWDEPTREHIGDHFKTA